MDYNTQREKLMMPEYGRNVQKMVEYVKAIEDKDKRNEQVKAVVEVMGILNPTLRDIQDFKHKLWDHVQIISKFDIDIESPFPIPTKETFLKRPEKIHVEKTPVKAAHYGRNIENMIEIVAAKEDGEVKDAMIKALATYMRQQYLIWNKDTVSEETIFNDMRKLSNDKLIVPEYIHLGAISSKENFSRPGIMNNDMSMNSGMKQNRSNQFRPQNKNNKNVQNNNKKKWNKPGFNNYNNNK